MKPIDRFLGKPKSFWAIIRFVSQSTRYSSQGVVHVPSFDELRTSFLHADLDPTILEGVRGPSELAQDVLDYFDARARVLENEVKASLMDAEEASLLFEKFFDEFQPKCPIPMNKQKGTKRNVAFLTALVNMVVERNLGGLPCNFDPKGLTTFTRGNTPLRTLSRRLDGAFPSVVNPIAVWEIKEYYYTTTFGSRIADGVYETLMDGMEIEEMKLIEGIDVRHYFIADAYLAWWKHGKSYLCRLFDMLHMGYVDEILFGRKVVDELPRIVSEWVEAFRSRR